MIISVFGIVLSLKSIRCQNEMEPFAVEGQFSDIIDFPHSACLGISQTLIDDMGRKRVSWICGSSILNQKVLLTAAHCVYKCGGSASILVQYGDENREKSMKTMALRYINHPEYSEAEPAGFDVALVLVKAPIPFGVRVSRVALLRNPPYDEMGLIAGWGFTDEIQQIRSNHLKHINQKIMNHAKCQKTLAKTLPKGIVCGGGKNAKTYAARGDSGSALVVRGYIQVGIVSCKCPDISRSIGIYTDVGYYYSWITENALELLCI